MLDCSGCHRDCRLSRVAGGPIIREMADTELIFLVEEAAEGGYTARALGHAIHTEAETVPELKTMVQDAVRCHFDEADRPAIVRLHLVRDELIQV